MGPPTNPQVLLLLGFLQRQQWLAAVCRATTPFTQMHVCTSSSSSNTTQGGRGPLLQPATTYVHAATAAADNSHAGEMQYD